MCYKQNSCETPMKLYETLWNSMKLYETLWNNSLVLLILIGFTQFGERVEKKWVKLSKQKKQESNWRLNIVKQNNKHRTE